MRRSEFGDFSIQLGYHQLIRLTGIAKIVWDIMQELENIIETLEILRDAVWAEDSEKSFEAVTICLMQFMVAIGHDDNLVSVIFPVLEELKNHIQAEEFEAANPIVLACLAKFRSVKDGMDDNTSHDL